VAHIDSVASVGSIEFIAEVGGVDWSG